MDKVFTFWIHCSTSELKGGARIVAKDELEAREKFKEYCLNELGLSKPYEITSMSVIYNPDDEKVYEDVYGKPEEYAGL